MSINKLFIFIIAILLGLLATILIPKTYNSDLVTKPEDVKNLEIQDDKYKIIHSKYLNGEGITEKEHEYITNKLYEYTEKLMEAHEENFNKNSQNKLQLSVTSYIHLIAIWFFIFIFLMFTKTISSTYSKLILILISGIVIFSYSNLVI